MAGVGPQSRRISRGFQPRQFRLEFEAQLRALLFRQPIGHLRKDGAIERRALRVPRHLLRRPCLGQNLVQVGADLVGIGTIDGRRLILEQIILFVVAEKVALAGGGNHILHGSVAESAESCAILHGDASRASDLSPQPTDRPLTLAFSLAFRTRRILFGDCKRARVAEFFRAAQPTGADAVQQVRLVRFQSNEPPEDIQQIQQIGCVLRQPMIRLD